MPIYIIVYMFDILLWNLANSTIYERKKRNVVLRLAIQLLLATTISFFKVRFIGVVWIVFSFLVMYPSYVLYGLFFFKTSIKKQIYCIFAYFSMSMFVEYIFIILWNIQKNSYQYNVCNTDSDYMLAVIQVKIVELIVLYSIFKYLKKSKSLKFWQMVKFILPITLMLLVTNIFMGIEVYYNRQFAIYGLFTTVVTFGMTIVFIDKYKKKVEEKARCEKELEFVKTQLKMSSDYKSYIEEVQEMRHDLKNHLCSVAILLENNHTEQALQYIRDIIPTVSDKQRLCEISCSMMAIVIYGKQIIAENKGIDFKSDVQIEDLLIPPKDVNIILSNMLDNAIEACDKLDRDKHIDLKIYIKDDRIFIDCRNTYDEEPVIRDNKIVTSKMNKINHGIGIEEIRKVTARNGGSTNIRFKKSIFILTITFDAELAWQ